MIVAKVEGKARSVRVAFVSGTPTPGSTTAGVPSASVTEVSPVRSAPRGTAAPARRGLEGVTMRGSTGWPGDGRGCLTVGGEVLDRLAVRSVPVIVANDGVKLSPAEVSPSAVAIVSVGRRRQRGGLRVGGVEGVHRQAVVDRLHEDLLVVSGVEAEAAEVGLLRVHERAGRDTGGRRHGHADPVGVEARAAAR